MTVIKSHLQPRHYLKGFLAALGEAHHEVSLFVYKKNQPFRTKGTKSENNPARTGIGKTGIVKNFYAFLKEDGTSDAEKYERRLEHEIERPGNAVLDKLRSITLAKNESLKIGELLDDAERRTLARYVAGMFARSKESRRRFDDALSKTSEKFRTEYFTYESVVRNLVPEEKAAFDRRLDAVAPGFDPSSTAVRAPDDYLRTFEAKTLRDESFPKNIFATIDFFSLLLLDMKWQIRLTSFDGFFTGDFPVAWSNLLDPKATVLFPISSRALFCAGAAPQTDEIVFMESRTAFVTRVRAGFAENCTELYFTRQAEWLVDFFNKR